MTQNRPRWSPLADATPRHLHLVGEARHPVDSLPAADGEPDQGATPRFALLIRAAKLTCDDGEFLCVVRDASETGVSVRLFHTLPPDVDLALEMPNGDRHPVERVWEYRENAGFRFRQPVALNRIIEGPSRFPKRPVRVQLEVPCCLVIGNRRVRAMVGNLSQHGALIRTPEYLSLVQRINMEVEGLSTIAARVCWRRNDCYGLSFEDTFQFAELAALAFVLQREEAPMFSKPGGTA